MFFARPYVRFAPPPHKNPAPPHTVPQPANQVGLAAQSIQRVVRMVGFYRTLNRFLYPSQLQVATLTAENRRLAHLQAQASTASPAMLHQRIDALLTTLEQNCPMMTSQSLQGHPHPALHNTKQGPHFAMPSPVQPLAAPHTMLPDFVPVAQQASHRRSSSMSGSQLRDFSQQPSLASSTMSLQHSPHNESAMYQEGGDIYARPRIPTHRQPWESSGSEVIYQK